MTQEAAVVVSDKPIDFEAFPLGAVVRILPNHSCMTAAMFAEYNVVEDAHVVARWTPCKGW